MSMICDTMVERRMIMRTAKILLGLFAASLVLGVVFVLLPKSAGIPDFVFPLCVFFACVFLTFYFKLKPGRARGRWSMKRVPMYVILLVSIFAGCAVMSVFSPLAYIFAPCGVLMLFGFICYSIRTRTPDGG